MGMYVAEMNSDSFQLLDMAERGILLEFFGKRSRNGTPLIGILFSASDVLLLSWLSFQEIVAAENFLYCFRMILEFLAFVWLRVKHPFASQPCKIPVGTIGAILMCIPPTILICIVLALSTLKVFLLKYWCCGNWPCDAALSQVCGERDGSSSLLVLTSQIFMVVIKPAMMP